MTEVSSWRSLKSVMIVTIHVAAVAFVIRSLAGPSAAVGPVLFWVPVTIVVAVFLSWPIGRAIATAFDPGDLPTNKACPRCGQLEIRPLVRFGGGLFQPTTGYTCAACWTSFRDRGRGALEMDGRLEVDPIDPSGISYLSDPIDEAEIRFLDEGDKSPRQSS